MNLLTIKIPATKDEFNKLMSVIANFDAIKLDNSNDKEHIYLSFASDKQLLALKKQILIEFGEEYHYSYGKYGIMDIVKKGPVVPNPIIERIEKLEAKFDRLEAILLDFIKEQRAFNARVEVRLTTLEKDVVELKNDMVIVKTDIVQIKTDINNINKRLDQNGLKPLIQ
jgi:hypothetical protein